MVDVVSVFNKTLMDSMKEGAASSPTKVANSSPVSTDLAALYEGSALSTANHEDIVSAISVSVHLALVFWCLWALGVTVCRANCAWPMQVKSGVHITAARASIVKQFRYVFQRAMLTQWRDVKYNKARLFVILGMFLFMGLVFRDLKRHDFATVQVRSSCD